MFMVFEREVHVECDGNVLDTEVLVAFVKYGYMMVGYISMMRDVDLEKIHQRASQICKKI